MAERNTDVIIFGAGIAGLWTLKRLKERGYNVLVLEKNAIGWGQTIASQGIIHSGLKYKLGGKGGALAENIRAMPDRWREALGDTCTAAPSQNLFIPKGFIGGIAKLAAQATLNNTREIADWPAAIKASGFEGSIIAMDEPVLDAPQVLTTLAVDNAPCIRKLAAHPGILRDPEGNIHSIDIDGEVIAAKCFIFAAAGNNDVFAKRFHHNVEIQKRPLLMGMMKNAPFPLYAHFVGNSDKPVATITTHITKDGARVWYVGGLVAERAKTAPAEEVYDAIQKAFAKYMPKIDLANIEWATLPIDRVECKSGAWMPDAPSVHRESNVIYCWPTKLTFAPLLADMIEEKINDIKPSGGNTDWSFLPECEFAETPWDKAAWKKLN